VEARIEIMAFNTHRSEQFELLHRGSSDSQDDDFQNYRERLPPRRGLLGQWDWIRHRKLHSVGQVGSLTKSFYRCFCSSISRRHFFRGLRWLMVVTPGVVVVLVVFTFIFLPSYTHRPAHYDALQEKCQQSEDKGRGNVNKEKVFIAATLHDPAGQLLNGEWGHAITTLVDLLGPENVYLSIYENDADSGASQALDWLNSIVECRQMQPRFFRF
jgi:hypothetical protein